MRKLLALIAVFAMTVGTLYARDRVTHDAGELPVAAQKLLKTYFPKIDVSYIKIDSGLFGKDYDVVLVDGTELDFDKKGRLKEVDCKKKEVPDGLVLKSIKEYVAKYFKGCKIVSMDVESRKYGIELSDGTELEFDRSGKFMRIDD